jgi:CRP-like cAMP-binding protein
VDTIDIFKHSESIEQIPGGQVIFEQGDPADVMYAVVDGALEVEVNGTIVGTIGPGEVVGEMALVDRERRPRSATVRASTDSRVVAVDEAEFMRLVHRTPFFALQLLRIVAERLRRTNDLL